LLADAHRRSEGAPRLVRIGRGADHRRAHAGASVAARRL
jgi:hypothetical protein